MTPAERGFKSRIILRDFHDGAMEFYSPEEPSSVIPKLQRQGVLFVQTIDAHCVLVRPELVAVVEVRGIESEDV